MANHIHVGNKVFVDYFDGNEVINLEGTVVKVLVLVAVENLTPERVI